MHKTSLLSLTILSFYLPVEAQTPEGYQQGHIFLSDGSSQAGLIKDQMRQKSSVVLLQDQKKQTFAASDINGAEIEGTSYRCIQGDFFRVICNGPMAFLQKASHAEGKTIYNGTDAVYVPGTEGKVGDYFAYTGSNLIRITSKNKQAFINQYLAGNESALAKARSAQTVAGLADAIQLYNQQHN
ncbi:MAG TPA: hypothetical protein PKK69_00675 [Ferruginibacter sp.]|nr:hypothetical protein [Ferruginibacter sp.]